MNKIELTLSEEEELKSLHRKEKNKRKADRIKAILLLSKGMSAREVSELLLLDEDSVRNFKTRFEQRNNLKDWYQDNYKGFVGKLSYIQLSLVRTFLRLFMVQDKKQVINYISDSFKVTYTRSGLQKLLDRIGCSFKKLHRLPGKVDLKKQDEFIDFFEQMVDSLPDRQTIMFMDGVHPLHNSVCSKTWGIKGEVKWIESNTGRQRLNINGAYNYFNQDVIFRTDPTINAESTIKLLGQIADNYPQMEKVYVFCDNARANKCSAVREWLKAQGKIVLLYLPPYSPNLNLIERLWKYMRKETMNARYYPLFEDFEAAITSFFDEIGNLKEELAKFIGQKFQIFKPRFQ